MMRKSGLKVMVFQEIFKVATENQDCVEESFFSVFEISRRFTVRVKNVDAIK
jgi:hypothetical protein